MREAVLGAVAADSPQLPDWPAQSDLGWHPTPEQVAQFEQLYQLVLAGNQRVNLTRIVEPADFWEKHLWDSLRGLAAPCLAGWEARPVRAIDLGTGAGFPGLAIALARPNWSVTLLDSVGKKTDFVAEAVRALGLDARVQVVRERAEVFGRQAPQSFDLVTLRAVATIDRCVAYALPLLAAGGVALLYRGQWSVEDDRALEQALAAEGGTLVALEGFRTPLSGGDRHCVYCQRL